MHSSCETVIISQHISHLWWYRRRNDEKERFPNVAGFCRFCGVGQSELERLSRECPRDYDALCSVFEDEALNSDIAVTLIGAYMKKRLGYGGDKKPDEKDGEDDIPTIVFMHDIMKDGE